MLRRSLSLARNTIKLYLSDPAPLMVFIFMPLGLMLFMTPASRALLVAQGYVNAGGAEQAVPGMTVMFAFFVISVIGIPFYREQGWGTWDRLRIASGTMEILVGKIAPGLLLLLLQLVVVFVAGALLFHLHVAGSVAALVLIAIAFAICIMAMTMMMIAWCKTLDQLNVLSNVFALVLPGLGGSFAPVSEMRRPRRRPPLPAGPCRACAASSWTVKACARRSPPAWHSRASQCSSRSSRWCASTRARQRCRRHEMYSTGAARCGESRCSDTQGNSPVCWQALAQVNRHVLFLDQLMRAPVEGNPLGSQLDGEAGVARVVAGQPGRQEPAGLLSKGRGHRMSEHRRLHDRKKRVPVGFGRGGVNAPQDGDHFEEEELRNGKELRVFDDALQNRVRIRMRFVQDIPPHGNGGIDDELHPSGPLKARRMVRLSVSPTRSARAARTRPIKALRRSSVCRSRNRFWKSSKLMRTARGFRPLLTITGSPVLSRSSRSAPR